MSRWMGLFSRASASGRQAPAKASVAGGTMTLGHDDLGALLEANADFVWRSVRRLGVPEAWADDATQQVFVIAQQKITSIAVGRERAFLFAVAINVASHIRRAAARRREVLGDDDLERPDPAPLQDVELDRQRARALLDEVLDAMELDLRTVFVLSELEEMTMADIAVMLGIPTGTVASRLRRGRDDFHKQAQRLRARVERCTVRPPEVRSSQPLVVARTVGEARR